MRYRTTELDASTWDGFADLVERNNGIFGGCWCLGNHLPPGPRNFTDARQRKEALVRSGDAHAALVLDDDGAVQGWAQYGSPEELPGIKHRIAYQKDAPPTPDWRIICVFVDKRHRGRGVARAAVAAAVAQIAERGGGLVEAISEVTDGREAQGRFLFSATVELFTDLGFTRGRQLGKHAYVVNKVVRARRPR